MGTGNDLILRQKPKPDWHKRLPEYYVSEGSPDLAAQMTAFANAGVRSVEVLTREEYEYLMNLEQERLQKGAEGLVFAESEATSALQAQAARRGVRLSIVPDEQYQTDLVMGWLASLASDS